MKSINDIRAKFARENYRGRSIAIYGIGKNLVWMRKKIEEFTNNIVLIDTYKHDGETVLSPQALEGCSDQYYIVVSIVKYQAEVFELLEQYGYAEGKDFSYFVTEAKEIYDDYEDPYGNRVIGKLGGGGIKVKFMGHDSTIHVGKGFRAQGLEITIGSNVSLEIGESVTACKKVIWGLEDDSKVKIGSATRWVQDGAEIWCKENSVCDIGKKCSFRNDFFVVSRNTQLIIGDNALFGQNVIIRTHDEHLIYDLKSGECINDARYLKREVVIGEHVWVGQDAYILYNTVIGNGSVVGARSLVKGKFPNNCILAGMPARIIKRDIAWSSGYLQNGLLDLPEEYRRFTAE